jgi:hypothetical protein
MSIFGKILSALGIGSGSAAGTGSAAVPSGGGGAAAMSQVDVEKVVSEFASKKKEKLDWRKSIVDLMKVLDLDSSLKNRQELAKELGYTGDMNDSAKMNIWLHKQVMTKLAESGGKVPDSLKA